MPFWYCYCNFGDETSGYCWGDGFMYLEERGGGRLECLLCRREWCGESEVGQPGPIESWRLKCREAEFVGIQCKLQG